VQDNPPSDRLGGVTRLGQLRDVVAVEHFAPAAYSPGVDGPPVEHLAHVGFGIAAPHDRRPSFGDAGQRLLQEVLGGLPITGEQVCRASQRR